MPRRNTTPDATTDTQPTSRDINRLADALESVGEHLGVVRAAIDEAREIIEWGLRNNRFVASVKHDAFRPEVASSEEPSDASAPAAVPAGTRHPTPAGAPVTRPETEPTVTPAAATKPEPAKEATNAPVAENHRRQAGKKKMPLYERLHYKPMYGELVRLVGYEGRPLPELQSEFKPMGERYGREAVEEAANEILVMDESSDPPTVRLTDEARKLAWPILGQADATPSSRPKKRS